MGPQAAIVFLLNLLLGFVEQVTVEELSHGDAQSVAKFFDGNNTGILAFLIQHAVYC